MDKEIINLYILSDSREITLWDNSIFVFDSSALLDLYFLPKLTREEVYQKIFKKLDKRLWIPFHVQFEYLKNRTKIIKKPISEKYDPLRNDVSKVAAIVKSEILKKIEALSRSTQKDDKHPHLEQSKITNYKKIVEAFIADTDTFTKEILLQIDNTEKEILSVQNHDDVLSSLEQYFDVGREFTFNEILEITREGKHRYEFKIPPGYGDLESKEKKGTQIFGDLIVWKQILEYSKYKKLPIIFITNDIKKNEDWCYLDKEATEDRILRPREELIKEIKDYSNVDFWMYNLPQFLHNANKYLKSSIKEEAIQNISQLINTKHKKNKILKFKCEECKRIHMYKEDEIDLNFECVGGDERSMGTENQYKANEFFECECHNEIEVTFEVWEYPVGVHNYDSVRISGGILIETFPFTINFFKEEEEEEEMCSKCGKEPVIDNYVGICLKCEENYGYGN